MCFDSDFFEWIDKNQSVDPNLLRLKYHSHKDNKPWINIAIDHIASMRKASKKLLNNEINLIPSIISPSIAIEQCSSASTALYHKKIIESRFASNDLHIADLTCGLGIDTSVFAKDYNVLAVEKSELQYQIALHNFKDCKTVALVNDSCEHFIKSTDLFFDVIFIDPSRRSESGKKLYSLKDYSPDVLTLLDEFKKHSYLTLIKVSPMLDIKQLLRDLNVASHLHVIEAEGECKELLVEIDWRRNQIFDIERVPITVHSTNFQDIIFTFEDELCLTGYYYPVSIDNAKYIYLPSSGINKAGCYRTVCQQQGLQMVSPNSHLFISNTLVNVFPGKTYKIIWVRKDVSKVFKELKKKSLMADVTSKNFYLSAKEIMNKLSIKPDNKYHLIATSDYEGKSMLIFAEKYS